MWVPLWVDSVMVSTAQPSRQVNLRPANQEKVRQAIGCFSMIAVCL